MFFDDVKTEGWDVGVSTVCQDVRYLPIFVHKLVKREFGLLTVLDIISKGSRNSFIFLILLLVHQNPISSC